MTWAESYPLINDALKANGEKPFESLGVLKARVNEVIKCNPDVRFDTFTEQLEKQNFPDEWKHGWIKSKGASIYIKK